MYTTDYGIRYYEYSTKDTNEIYLKNTSSTVLEYLTTKVPQLAFSRKKLELVVQVLEYWSSRFELIIVNYGTRALEYSLI